MTHSGHIRVKARNVDGHVCGEMHHRAKWPDAVVALARDIAEQRGIGARRVTWELRQLGHAVSLECVKNWLDYHCRTLVRPSSLGP